MMLIDNSNKPNKYITHDRNRIGRIKEILELLRTNETTNVIETVNMLEALFERWMKHGNCIMWNHIVDGMKELPGTEEEKKIFALGYIARVFLTEIKDEQ